MLDYAKILRLSKWKKKESLVLIDGKQDLEISRTTNKDK